MASPTPQSHLSTDRESHRVEFDRNPKSQFLYDAQKPLLKDEADANQNPPLYKAQKPLAEKEIVDLTHKNTTPQCGKVVYGLKVAAYYGMYGCLLIISALVYLLSILTGYGAYRLYHHFKEVGNLRDGVEKHNLAAVQRALQIPIAYGPEKRNKPKCIKDWTEDELTRITLNEYTKLDGYIFTKEDEKTVRAFVRDVKKLEKAIADGASTKDIRSKIKALSKNEVYQALKQEKDAGPAVEFIQIAYRELSGGRGNGEDFFAEYGHKVIGDLKDNDGVERETFDCDELATVMDEQVKKADFTRNGKIATTIWTLYHPFAAMHTRDAAMFPLEFDSHEGNPDIYGHDFVLPRNVPGEDGYNPALPINEHEKTLEFYYGPGPTGDNLYDDVYLAYMDRLAKNGVPVFERRTNHQNMREKPEAYRIHEMRRYEKAHPDSLRLMSLSYDTDLTHEWEKGKKPPVFENSTDFMNQIRKEYFQDFAQMYKGEGNDVYIPANVLTEDQVIAGVNASDGIFETLSQNESGTFGKQQAYWNNLSPERQARMMLLGTHAVIGAGSLYKALQDAPYLSAEDLANKRLDASLAKCRANGACKQDIDRAVTENIAERIYFRFLTNSTPLTRSELDSIVGAVVARAQIVEGRSIQDKRYVILSDLLHFIGNQAGMQAVSRQMQDYVKDNFAPQQQPLIHHEPPQHQGVIKAFPEIQPRAEIG